MTRHTLSKRELEDLHAILRRAAERAERNRRTADAEKLALEVARIDMELKGME